MPATRQRDEIPAADKWNVAAIYASTALGNRICRAQGMPRPWRLLRRLAEASRCAPAIGPGSAPCAGEPCYAHLRVTRLLACRTCSIAYAIWVKISTAGAYLSPDLASTNMASWLQGRRSAIASARTSCAASLSPAGKTAVMVGPSVPSAASIRCSKRRTVCAPSITDDKGQEQRRPMAVHHPAVA